MHRNPRVPLAGTTALLVALLTGGVVSAQEQVPPPVAAQPVIVPLNGTVPIQMTTKKLISRVEDPGTGIVNIQILKRDPTTALLTGASSGVTQIALIDVDKNREVFEVVVQTDVQHLKYILRKAVPAANIDVVPSANNAFVLTGYVQRAEDIPIALAAATSVVGNGRIVNALRDGGVMQVQLCVTVARVARSEARSMGFSFLEGGGGHFISSVLSAPLNMSGINNPGIAASTAALAGNPNIVFGVLNDQQGFLGFLNALRNENLVKVLAEPKLVTLSGRPAEFISGGEQAVPTLASGSAGGGAVSGVEFRPFGTTVRFLPIVLGDGKIYLEVEPQFTFPDPSNLFSAPIPGTNSVVFGRTTQRVRTSVIMEDGQTFAIGGMVFHSVNGTTSKIPVLGDLPFIGTAFSTITYTDAEEELLVLVTPRLVDAMSCDQVPKLLPGQETRSPDDCELFLERILEAPRGPRKTFHGLRYVPAYKSSPSAVQFPCARHGQGRCDCAGDCGGNCHACDFLGLAGGCGPTGCATGGCGTGNCGATGPGLAGHVQPASVGTVVPGPLPVEVTHPVGAVPKAASPVGGTPPTAPGLPAAGARSQVPVRTLPASPAATLTMPAPASMPAPVSMPAPATIGEAR
ncbi:MAG: hypothetical protein IT429_12370 [Gemmataceae bacterium]|nr:hypothetical protein [Gemmataceae bacterium]